jgi:hypothetical protein
MQLVRKVDISQLRLDLGYAGRFTSRLGAAYLTQIFHSSPGVLIVTVRAEMGT